jgi:hypothetical protein
MYYSNLYYSNLYSVDVLVNGNNCKQYNHENKIFIEAKDGSEYEIKIGNHSSHRVLAVSAVDGLNILTGEIAREEDSGYVINGYDSMKIKGFRYSDDKVGAFKFTSKNKSYAASKGEAHNVGVIGIRIFDEQYSSYQNTNIWYHNTQIRYNTSTINPPWTITCDGNGTLTSNSGQTTNVNWGNNVLRSTNFNSTLNETQNGAYLGYCSNNITSKGFDMGTDWGQVKESKVKEVEFKKGFLNYSVDIYYASRESLLEMGIPLTNEAKVTFPSSFPKKYATPPKNWKV